MSSHADTIRDYTTNTERYDGQWHRLPTEQEVLAALDALLAEIEEWRVLAARQLEEFTVTTQEYRAENQRLRDERDEWERIAVRTSIEAGNEIRRIRTEALAGDTP